MDTNGELDLQHVFACRSLTSFLAANVSLPSIAPEWPAMNDWSPSRRSCAPSPPPASPFASGLLSAPLSSSSPQSDQCDPQTYFDLPLPGLSQDHMQNYTIPPSAMALPEIPVRRPEMTRSATEPKKRVPRPPNAFMLFRSWLIKNKKVPVEVEKRQQNLSRIAGRCWNMLHEQEKAQWRNQAALVLKAHKNKHPDYKFTPAPKGTGRAGKFKREELDGELIDDATRIQLLAEMYCPELKGRDVSPSKKRPSPKIKKQDFDEVNFRAILSRSSPSYSSSPATSGMPSPASYPSSLASGSPAMSSSSPGSSPITPSTTFHYPPYLYPESYAYAPSRIGVSSPSLGQYEIPYTSFDHDQVCSSFSSLAL